MKKFLLNIWYTILYQFEQHRDEIPEWWYRDKPFECQPEWVQRITIARDVIAQIELKRFYPKRGRYINIDEESGYKGSVKENFNTLNRCQVCAIGGCFLSIVRFKNQVHFNEITDIGAMRFKDNSKFRNILMSIFPIEQLILIENAFEAGPDAGGFGASPIFGTDEEKRAVPRQEKENAQFFGEQYKTPDLRLIAIMQNIIDNKGTFKP